MNTRPLFVGIVLLFSIIFFSGCSTSEVSTSGDTDKVKITDIEISTEVFSFSKGWINIGSGFKPEDVPELNTNNSDYLTARYMVAGTVRNIIEKTLNTTQIFGEFYDENNKLLFERDSNKITNLKSGLSSDFFLTLQTHSNEGDFYKVHHIVLRISAK